MRKEKNKHFRIRLEWDPADVFIGLYVRGPRLDLDLEPGSNNYYWNIWICLIPCLPIHIRWMSRHNFGKKSSFFGFDLSVEEEPICEKCNRKVAYQPVVGSFFATSGTVCIHGYLYRECLHHLDGTQAGVNCDIVTIG